MAVVISSDLVLGDAVAEIALEYPRILWDSILRRDGAIITASSEQVGFEGENVASGFTWDFWRPETGTATLEIEITESEECDYALLAAHTLGDAESEVSVEYYDGAAWQPWSEVVSPGSNKVLAFLNDSVIASRFRLVVASGVSPDIVPSIGVLQIGKALAVERGVTLDHRPITMQRRTVARPQIAEGGQLLGRSIIRQGVETEITFEALRASWMRTHFDPFVESARVHPFGWVWAPVDYPAEVAYLWTPAGAHDIHPEHSGLPDRMNVKFPVVGIVE